MHLDSLAVFHINFKSFHFQHFKNILCFQWCLITTVISIKFDNVLHTHCSQYLSVDNGFIEALKNQIKSTKSRISRKQLICEWSNKQEVKWFRRKMKTTSLTTYGGPQSKSSNNRPLPDFDNSSAISWAILAWENTRNNWLLMGHPLNQTSQTLHTQASD